MDTRQEKLEQIEDAQFALLMYDLAEKEGQRLLELNKQLQNDPTAAVPETLDKKCRKTIADYYKTQENRKRVRTLKSIGKKILIAASIATILFTSAFALSEDFRVRTMDLLLDVQERYTAFSFIETAELEIIKPEEPIGTEQEPTESSALEEVNAATQANAEVADFVDAGYFPDFEITWVPQGWYLYEVQSIEGLSTTVILTNGKDQFLNIGSDYLTPGEEVLFDTEDAYVENIQIQGYDTQCITEDESTILVIIRPELQNLISISCAVTPTEDVIRIAENIIFYD
ncbi:DUF4367 domain-containing protein [Bengtsoniella intestinalis]|uniref:DUF4367 domain-containing protein n=1 Tax=Bengtsoniella intestinalis TaxID=3073143 RepID=UPI00391F022A